MSIDDNGRLRDASIHREALRMAEFFPTISSSALEVNRLFVRCHRALTSVSDAHLDAYGLSASRGSVVGLLHGSHERFTTVDVAAALEVSSAAASKLIDGLERDGWVERVANPDDARSTLVQLTEHGQSQAEDALKAAYEFVTTAWSGLSTEEQDILIHLLSKVRFHLKTTQLTWADMPAPSNPSKLVVAEKNDGEVEQ